MKKATRPWARKAEDDYQTARRLLDAKTRLYDQICFHCQQAAEKYLKAILQEQGAAVPRTHDLPDLHHLLLAGNASLRGLRRRLVFLTQFAVDFRYPGAYATARQARDHVARGVRGTRQIDNRRHHAKPALGFAWRSQFQPEAAE
jgi:HEPN domain-containing protein